MQPVVTPTEMAVIDAEASESVDVLIERAAWAVAREAAAMLDGSLYGKRIAVLAGKGNNGADGRGAVRHLEQRGARCTVVDVPVFDVPLDSSVDLSTSPLGSYRFDLVIDACVGTGLSRPFDGRELRGTIGDAPVLAVDIPSGVDGLTGHVAGWAIPATRTVTFAAPKPGALLQPGRDLTGELLVADIGLDCSRATIHHLDAADLSRWPVRATDAHKWNQAVLVVGGSPGMTGAPSLAAHAAFRSGAGYVALSIPGLVLDQMIVDQTDAADPLEAVLQPVDHQWADSVLAAEERFGAVVIGPGLSPDHGDQLAQFLAAATTPTVLDAGALTSLASLDDPAQALAACVITPILTPHEGEFAKLNGEPVGQDRIEATRRVAERLQAVVLLKGPTTVVAHPDGRVLLSTAGDARLATAGTGDVLAGIIGSAIASGLDPFLAAASGAEVHGLAAASCDAIGLVAGDIPPAVARVLSGSG